ncbi:MAG: CBS domain-containing protein [Ignavibacteriae bacterium]|nr:MAG: CBS domain-containing protein [Ignavibacteriota bacterium]
MQDNVAKVIPLFSRKVYSVLIDDSIGEALKIMYDYSFSQLPVYKDGKFYDLLTTNTITRWLGSCVDDDIFSLKDTKIIEVLKFTEIPDNYFFLKEDAPLTEALERFNEFESIGKPLDAILITQNGTPTGAPLGIITSTDFPKILNEMESHKL